MNDDRRTTNYEPRPKIHSPLITNHYIITLVPFFHYKPRAPLDEFIELLWFNDDPGLPHAQERLLPTGTVELIFNLKEDQTRTYDKNNLAAVDTASGSIVC